jgi:hypothetical protein
MNGDLSGIKYLPQGNHAGSWPILGKMPKPQQVVSKVEDTYVVRHIETMQNRVIIKRVLFNSINEC